MKKLLFLLPVVAVMATLTLTSSQNGYTSVNRTGSDGGTTGCTSCHGSSRTTTVTVGVLLDSAGTMITHYTPGSTYTIHFYGINGTGLTLPKFGFQFSVVKGTGSTSTQAGTFGTLPTSTAKRTITGRDIMYHTTPITGGTVGDTISVSWTAPAAGSGTVTMYALMNLVNGDGRDASSDKWNLGSASFTEITIPTGVSNATINSRAAVYPNPVINNLTLQIGSTADGFFPVTIVDLGGNIVYNANTEFRNGIANLDASTLPAGLYHIVTLVNGAAISATISKQ